MSLSKRQQEFLEFMHDYWREHQRTPTIREIQEKFKISSTSVVSHHLKALEEKKCIDRTPGVSRGIKLVDSEYLRLAHDATVRVPFWGYIVASEPVSVPDVSTPPSRYLDLTREIVGDSEGVFALEVRGDSMIDALVNDGDIVLMKKVPEVRNGDMVAVWLKDEQETTLKKFYREGNRVRLQPANPTMKPIYTKAANVDIQGKVVVIIRQVA
ncbi:MAG: transcriptional repressor LexA [Anaerolineae bacterium]